MTRLVIKPQMPGGGLGFDLRDVLQALGPRVSTSAWTIDDLTYVSRDEREIPAFHGSEHARIIGWRMGEGEGSRMRVEGGIRSLRRCPNNGRFAPMADIAPSGSLTRKAAVPAARFERRAKFAE